MNKMLRGVVRLKRPNTDSWLTVEFEYDSAQDTIEAGRIFKDIYYPEWELFRSFARNKQVE